VPLLFSGPAPRHFAVLYYILLEQLLPQAPFPSYPRESLLMCVFPLWLLAILDDAPTSHVRYPLLRFRTFVIIDFSLSLRPSYRGEAPRHRTPFLSFPLKVLLRTPEHSCCEFSHPHIQLVRCPAFLSRFDPFRQASFPAVPMKSSRCSYGTTIFFSLPRRLTWLSDLVKHTLFPRSIFLLFLLPTL